MSRDSLPRPGRLNGRHGWIAAAGVLAVGAVLRLLAVHEDLLYDPLAYSQYAYNLVQGTYSLRDDYAFAHRLTVIGPLALSYAGLGLGEFSNLLWLHLVSLGQIAVVIWLGTRLFDRATGLLAGLLLALAPLDIVYTNFLTPDVVMAFFLTASAALWIVGNERGGRGAKALVFLAGVCLGLAVWTRLYSALLGILFAGYWLWRRTPWRRVAWAAAGGGAVAALLAVLYWRETGSALYFLTVQSSSFGGQVNPRGPDWGYYLWHLLHPRSPAGLLGWIWLAGLGVSLVRPTRERGILLLWSLPFSLYLQFGSMSLTSYEPVWKTLRYLSPLFAPLSLLAASLGVQFVRHPRPRSLERRKGFSTSGARALWLAALVALVAAQSLWIVVTDRAQHDRVEHEFEVTTEVLRREPELPILFDHWRTGIAFAYYFDYQEGANFYRNAADSLRVGRPGDFGESRFGYLSWYASAAEVPEALVVLDAAVWDRALRTDSAKEPYLGVRMPAYAADPPEDWRLVHRGERLRVYRVRPKRIAASDTSFSVARPGDNR